MAGLPRAPKIDGGTVWARGKAYGAGQFMPRDVAHYTVEQWYNPTIEEVSAGAVGRQQIVIVVGIGATIAEIQADLAEMRQARLDQRTWRDTPQTAAMLGEEPPDEEPPDESEFTDVPFPPQPTLRPPPGISGIGL